MMLFDFDPFETSVRICLAMSYTPRILNAAISYRPYNCFLYVVKGRNNYIYDGGRCTAGSGEKIYLPAGSVPYNYEVLSKNGEAAKTLR